MAARTYGPAPFRVAVVHGGPGAVGDMAPVAHELAARGLGTLEPLQDATSVDGQIQELHTDLAEHAPLTVVGHSWGAWLACLLAEAHPALVRRLVLVGSGPFETSYVAGLRATRLGRLSAEQHAEYERLVAREDVAALGALLSSADDYDAIEDAADVDVRPGIFQGVWPEADALRASGALLERVSRIRCPVRAIHGDHDPHPTAGVQEPLGRVLQDFALVELARCGHTPWRERHAREPFFDTLVGFVRGDAYRAGGS